MMSKVRGQMQVKEGWIEAENDHTTAKVDVTLDAASINTGVEARDNHLRSADGATTAFELVPKLGHQPLLLERAHHRLFRPAPGCACAGCCRP